ncbi:PREDICTED: pentatricopeptide repeat-containing protein At4g19220, mitochondrial [Ipomoea nil]|uniref:pentatricopeptide repeat-containing protein At4g19220, mitochondrial n=1 Tax=Ipomoea nil TaxID=35883 RepID=UPI000900ACE6|nr:PREDICTED: pentatricopeptide repeat-containing protein At4g19220, mitochondrial [Ipomoea nil]
MRKLFKVASIFSLARIAPPRKISRFLSPFQHNSCYFSQKSILTNALLSINPLPTIFRCSSPVLLHASACQAFDKMSQRVAQYPQVSNISHVLELIRLVREKPSFINAKIAHALVIKLGALGHLPTVTSLLMIYSRGGSFSSSMALFSEVLDKDVIVWNAIMTACIENNLFEAVVNFFLEMVQVGNEFDSTSLVILLSALCNMKDLRAGMGVHALCVKAGTLSDSFLSNALLDVYAKCNDLCSSENVFREMEFKDTVSWNSIISGCLYNGHPMKSLLYFKQMVSISEQVDSVSLSCAIAASACLEELTSGLAIHGLVIKLGYAERGHISVANSLISFYSQYGEVDAAKYVFKEMECKDVITWNSMINGLALNDEVIESFNLLHIMQFIGSMKPEATTLVSIISMASDFMLLREGKAVHGYIIRRGMESSLSVMNSLLNMYLSGNNAKKAEHLLRTMPVKDLVTWNTMISGYSQNGCNREAQALFKNLQDQHLSCSLPTLLGILSSCDSPQFLQFGKSIHCWHVKLGYESNILAVNSLMYMYIHCGDLVASFKSLEEISFTADVDSWNAVISGCTQNNHFGMALEAFNLMRQISRVNHDSITLVNAISACGYLQLVNEGKLIHGLALKTSSAQNNKAKEALALFHTFEFEPDEISLATILSLCTQLGIIRHGKQIHGHVLRSGYFKNSVISSALVDMYSSCGRLDIALQVFQKSPEKSIAAWNSVIAAYGLHSNGQKAIEVFTELIESGMSPTKATFVNLLTACSHSGLVDQGCWYYDHMLTSFGVQPTTDHHVCIVDMLGRSGRLQEAYNFVEDMLSQPESGIWGALLSACNYHGNLELGKKVANILFSLKPENVGYYVSLSNMYVATGSWKEAVELRDMVQSKKLAKPAAYSLIDVGLG